MATVGRSNKVSAAASKTPSGRVPQHPGIYMGFVTDNTDVQRSGKLRVWIPDFDTRHEDPSGWLLVSYCSPFAGGTPVFDSGKDATDYMTTPTSYGMWFTPPDIDNQVFIFFVGKDNTKGFWFGCAFQENANNMVPGVGASDFYTPKGKYGDKEVPLGEYLKRPSSTTPAYTVAQPYLDGVTEQGLAQDYVRGLNKASVSRQSPDPAKPYSMPEVYGILTPGPKVNRQDPNNRFRIGGSSFVMDDHPDHEYVMLRTRGGAQIKVDETNGIMYVINRAGTAWIQLDEEGNADIFAAKDMSFRAQGDFNIRADNNVNIEAGQNVNIKGVNDVKLQALNEMHFTVQNNILTTVTDGNHNLDVQTGTSDTKVAGDIKISTDGSLDIDVGGDAALSAGACDILASDDLNLQGNNVGAKALAETNIQSSGNTNLLGASVNINSGGGAPGASSADAASPADTVPKPTTTKTNVLADFNDQYKFDRKTEPLDTTVDRLMTYEPCPEHKNTGGQ